MNPEFRSLYQERINTLLSNEIDNIQDTLAGTRIGWQPSMSQSPGYRTTSHPVTKPDCITKARYYPKKWILKRNEKCQSNYSTLISDRGLNEGIHCWTFKILESTDVYLGLVFPLEEKLINDENLRKTYIGDENGSNSGGLLNKECFSIYLPEQTFVNESSCLVEHGITDLKLDDDKYEKAAQELISLGEPIENVNQIKESYKDLYTLLYLYKNPNDRIFSLNIPNYSGSAYRITIPYLSSSIRSKNYSQNFFSDSLRRHINYRIEAPKENISQIIPVGMKFGFVLNFINLTLHILVFNQTNNTNNPDKIIYLSNLIPGRSYYPAISMKGIEGIVELDISTSWQFVAPSYLEALQTELEISEDFRIRNQRLTDEIKSLHAAFTSS